MSETDFPETAEQTENERGARPGAGQQGAGGADPMLGPDSRPNSRQERDARLRARLLAFQRIGAPILSAIADWRYVDPDSVPEARTEEDDARLFAQMLDSTVTVANNAAEAMGAADGPEDDWMRWSLASALSNIVTAHFRATGRVLSVDDSERVVGAIDYGGTRVESFQLADERGRDRAIRSLRIRIVDAMAPVVGAVARFSFGRDAHGLVVQVTDTILSYAAEVTDRLAPASWSDEEWASMYKGVLHAACDLYADCHYAEMDRLLDMTPQERSQYVRQHEMDVPMEPVWKAFETRLSMLTTVVENLDLPDDGESSSASRARAEG